MQGYWPAFSVLAVEIHQIPAPCCLKDAIKWAFAFVQGFDTEALTASFEGEGGAVVTTSFDLLVGADGANSAVREALASQGKIAFTRVRALQSPIHQLA